MTGQRLRRWYVIHPSLCGRRTPCAPRVVWQHHSGLQVCWRLSSTHGMHGAGCHPIIRVEKGHISFSDNQLCGKRLRWPAPQSPYKDCIAIREYHYNDPVRGTPETTCLYSKGANHSIKIDVVTVCGCLPETVFVGLSLTDMCEESAVLIVATKHL